jgi:hypothetical protein
MNPGGVQHKIGRVMIEYCTWKMNMLNRITVVQECDARDDDSSNDAGNKNKIENRGICSYRRI